MDESRLRHRWERPIVLGSFLLNVLLFAGAILLLKYGGDWLDARPLLAKYTKELQTLAGAMLFAPVINVFLRNTRRAKIRANAARVSSEQFPEIHAVLERFSAALGVHPVPELYVWEDAPDFSTASSAWKTHYIVLKPKPLLKDLSAGRDIIEFLVGRELGRIRLGHTRWWDELLTTYVVKIPVLRNPLLQVRMLSQDRYGARLASSALRGLVLHATGPGLIEQTNLPAFARDARASRSFWQMASALSRPHPHLALRIQALSNAGLLEPGREPPRDAATRSLGGAPLENRTARV
jgi:hypothetical protein